MISSKTKWSDLLNCTATTMHQLLLTKKVSPREALEASLDRIQEVNGSLNAIPTLCIERAYEHCLRLENGLGDAAVGRTHLGGIPICIKDLTAVAGVRTTWGTVGLANHIPVANDPIVDQLETAGCIVVGKSNTPEMGAGNVTYNEVFGATRNPWNLNLTPGGSSGGSAAAVASGAVWLAQGTDLAGSLRNPAAYCGVVTLRTSPGRAGGPPSSVLFNTETVHGPIGRTVADVALGLDAMVGYDRRIPISIEPPSYSFLAELEKSWTYEPRIAYSRDLNGFAGVETSIQSPIENALRKLSSVGMSIAEDCPQLPNLYETYTVLRSMLWASGPGSQPDSVQAHFKPSLKKNIQDAMRLGVGDIYRALTNRTKLYNALLSFFDRYDCLVCPVIGKGAGPVTEEHPQEIDGHSINDYVDWLRFSFLAPAVGLPAMSIPIGLDESGMPVGLQLIGRPRGERELLLTAQRIEQILELRLTPIDPC